MLRRLSISLFGLVPLLTGCFAFQMRPPEIERPLWRPSDEIPPEQKNSVYTFVFGTLDVFDSGCTSGLRDYIVHLGYGKTYFGQSVHLSYFAQKMRDIAASCPDARFAIVGYSSGSVPASELAVEANKVGIPLELLVFIDPSSMCTGCDEALATRVLTINKANHMLGWVPLSCGEEVLIESGHHNGIPTHPVTIEVMERELNLIAMGIGLPPRVDLPRQPMVPAFPPPRKTTPKMAPLPAEWQFLDPFRKNILPNEGTKLPQPETTETLPPPRVIEK